MARRINPLSIIRGASAVLGQLAASNRPGRGPGKPKARPAPAPLPAAPPRKVSPTKPPLNESDAALSRLRAHHCYSLTHRVWDLVLLSLPLDLLILLMPPGRMPFATRHHELGAWIMVFLLASAIFTAKDFWLGALAALKQYRETHPNFRTHLSWLAVGLFTIVGFVEVFRAVTHGRILSVVMALISYVTAVCAFRYGSGKPKAAQPAAPTATGEQELMVISLLPVASARLVSALGAAAAVLNGSGLRGYALYLGTALLLLLYFIPERAQFISACMGCARWTSRAWQRSGRCLICAEKYAAAYRRKAIPCR